MVFIFILVMLGFLMWVASYFALMYIAKNYCEHVGRPFPIHSPGTKLLVFLLLPLCFPPTWGWIIAFIVSLFI